MIHGNNYQEWATRIFPGIKDSLDGNQSEKIDNETQVHINENNIEKKTSEENEIISEKNEYELLWEENVTL